MKSSEIAARTSSQPERFVEVERVVDEVSIAGLSLKRAGICVQLPDGAMVTGSAACADGDPVPRAEFELLERVVTLEAIRDRATFSARDAEARPTGLLPRAAVFPESDTPDVWRPARSNGVALHATWEQARDRAWWELCERDRVLRAWNGHGRPHLVDDSLDARLVATSSIYDWQVALFDGSPGGVAVEVAAVFGFPKRADAPMTVGYAARPSTEQAIAAAASEALQSLAFTWGEEIPREMPAPGPTALHHLERLLWPGSFDAFRLWLHDGHARHAAEGPPPPLLEADGFIDLTPPSLGGGMRVVKALARNAWPLHFGEGPRSDRLPAHLRLHPIP